MSAAHDLSEGGLAQALVEAALLHGIGAMVRFDGDPFVQLFSESAARAVVATPDADTVLAAAAAAGVPARRIGLTGGDRLVVDGSLDVTLTELRAASEGTLPALFG